MACFPAACISSVAGTKDMKYKLDWRSSLWPASWLMLSRYSCPSYCDLLQGILGFGLMQIHTPTLAGWRWIYIVEGAMTVTAGIVAWFFIVDFPQKAKFLHDYERERIIDRLNKDRGDAEHDQITRAKVLTHLSDWKLWVFGLMVFHLTIPGSY